MAIINDEDLRSVSGGAMREDDYSSLKDYLRLQKDQGFKLEEMLQKVEDDFNNKLDYYDLFDDAGNPLTLDVLKDSVKSCWEELG
ncbi:MAG: hypothetical protein Q4D71_14340 [Oscillospiraceae bacterium]|nr:hypothetical protein [Oscillospiraceae bacterium]